MRKILFAGLVSLLPVIAFAQEGDTAPLWICRWLRSPR